MAGHLSLGEVSRSGTPPVPQYPTRYVLLYMYTINIYVYYKYVLVDKDKYRIRCFMGDNTINFDIDNFRLPNNSIELS